MDKHGNDWFCYHATSASILPPGYCDVNQIPLTIPKGRQAVLLSVLVSYCMIVWESIGVYQ